MEPGSVRWDEWGQHPPNDFAWEGSLNPVRKRFEGVRQLVERVMDSLAPVLICINTVQYCVLQSCPYNEKVGGFGVAKICRKA